MKLFDPNLNVPAEIAQKAVDVKNWMAHHGAESVCGLGEIYAIQSKLDTATDSGVWLLEAAVKLQRQLEEVTRERDQYKHAAELAARLHAREARRQRIGEAAR